MGFIDNPEFMVEVDEYDDIGGDVVRTPILEFTPFDYEYLSTVHFPYDGMYALSDTGDLYQYDQLGGLFSRIKRGFKKLGRRIKKRAKKIGQKAKKLLSKTKFGKALIKVGGKALKTAMKLVKPLKKKVGQWAKKLAPVAAFIPGVGPAVAGALLKSGKLGPIMKRAGGKLKQIIAVAEKSGKAIPGFKLDVKDPARLTRELKKAARQISKLPPGRIEAMAQSMKQENPKTKSRKARGVNRASIAAAKQMRRIAMKERARDNAIRINRIKQRNPQRGAQIARHLAALRKLGTNPVLQ